MQRKGCSETALFAWLNGKRAEDTSHDFILSSMCTVPHPVAVRAHDLFIETNLGDPGLFPGTAEIEDLLVRAFGTLYHNPDATGYATSGGTESNIQAMRIARSLAGKKHPNVILPESAHFSFHKCCDMLGIEMRTVPLDASYRMDASKAGELVDDQTCCIIGVAGTTEYGMVDPIADLARIALEEEVFFHVDAAFGGLVLPFLEESRPFDFSLPGVSSIAVDPHKMGMSTIPCGCVLFRDEEMAQVLAVDTPYLSVRQVHTLAGTRPGGAVAGAYAVLQYLGINGMEALVGGCMKNTRRLITGLEAFGKTRAVTPDVNVATFEPFGVPPPWRVSHTRNGHLRIVCMPHVHADRIEAFIEQCGEMHA